MGRLEDALNDYCKAMKCIRNFQMLTLIGVENILILGFALISWADMRRP